MSQPSVTILGAGLSGLTLGRCLRRKGISSVIYDRASESPRHTYGITLLPWAYKPLLEVLELDEDIFKKRLAVDSIDQNGGGHISNREVTRSTAFRANRSKFELMLREGQDIHFEHSLSSAAIQEDGKVEIFFQNGLKLRPALVVDAEGVHSHLRKALLPEITPETQPFAVYSGKRYIKQDEFTSTYAAAFRNGNILVREPEAAGGPRLEISINDRQSNGTVSISYVYSRSAKSEGSVDPLYHPERSIAGATDIPEEFYEQLKDFVTASKPSQPFEECFNVNQIRSERLLHWLMRTVLVPRQDLLRLLRYGIVIIGDSAHAVPILGGEGANLAILDAIKLAEKLKDGQDNASVQNFYDEHWQVWCDAVEESKQSLAEMHKDTDGLSSNL